ncbi:MAG: M42 family metallopeptidase [Bacillota bacterium]
MDQTLELLKEITDLPGVPGHEGRVAQAIAKRMEGLAEIEYDNLGSIILRKKGSSDRPRIMLAGHMDEIGFLVTLITKEGFLRFQPLGGWFDQVLLAKRVVVHTRQNEVHGVIGSKPPHILSAEERKKVVEKKDMFIDIGASSEEEARAFGVRPGDIVTPYSPFSQLANGKLLMAKAWDDRIGCAMFMEVIRSLQTEAHPNTVYGVGTVQEEIGLRGATTSVSVVEPDVGFALEVGIAGDMPGVQPHEAQEKLGKGPAIFLYDGSMIPNYKLRDLTVEVAEREGIPIQFEALPGGGTDAGRIHTYKRGVPSLVVGVPTRYIHSHHGIIHRDDFENAVKLLVAVIKQLDANTVAGLRI